MSLARVYGHGRGSGSLAVVTRGIAGALDGESLLAGQVDLQAPPDLDTEDPPGALAHFGILTGHPGLSLRMTHAARHRRRLVFVAPNSSKIPERLARLTAEVATDVCTPSAWAAGVLREHFDLPVHVVPHGVSRIAPDDAAPPADAERPRCVHLTTSDRDRKGTLELLAAWPLIRKRFPAAELDVVADRAAASRLQQLLLLRDQLHLLDGAVQLVDRWDVSGPQLGDRLRQYACVIQPSRGEAFGMVPLEARAAGVPVVATACSGHSEHLSAGEHTIELSGVSIVEHGPDGPTDDVPYAVSPTVSPDAIVAATSRLLEQLPVATSAARVAAPMVCRIFDWQRQTAPLIQLIQETRT